MSKALFRFLRGELTSGFYLNTFQKMLNNYAEYIRTFFISFRKMQFDIETMSEEKIYSIGKTAGVFIPVLSLGEGYGASRLSESNIVNGVERSERGLFNRTSEFFVFQHTEQDDYPTDINTLADNNNKSSMAGTDDPTLGYISENEHDVIDAMGNVKTSKVLSTPPASGAYSNFYGTKFLYLSEYINEDRSIDPDIYLELYKVMQVVRYRGQNLECLCDVINILCPDGLIQIEQFVKLEDVNCFMLYYKYNLGAMVSQKEQRLKTFQYLMALKFPQIVLNEVRED